MANTRSAIKHIKTSQKKHDRNQAVKSLARGQVRRARGLIGQSPEESRDAVMAAITALDKGVKKGVLHRNNAARRKSRLMQLYNVVLAPKAAPAEEKPPRKRAAGAAKPGTSRAKASAAKATATKPSAAKAAAKPKTATARAKASESESKPKSSRAKAKADETQEKAPAARRSRKAKEAEEKA